MILRIFTVYDQKARYHLKPFLMQTKEEAIRAFTDAANDQSVDIGRHPEDYTLMEIGGFDDATAEIIPQIPIQTIGTAVYFLKGSSSLEGSEDVDIPPQKISNGSSVQSDTRGSDTPE